MDSFYSFLGEYSKEIALYRLGIQFCSLKQSNFYIDKKGVSVLFSRIDDYTVFGGSTELDFNFHPV